MPTTSQAIAVSDLRKTKKGRVAVERDQRRTQKMVAALVRKADRAGVTKVAISKASGLTRSQVYTILETK